MNPQTIRVTIVVMQLTLGGLMIAFGIDKFFNLFSYWPQYIPAFAPPLVHLSAQNSMYVIGVVEILTGLHVLFFPVSGGVLTALELLVVAVILLVIRGFYNIAILDTLLAVHALLLARLAYERKHIS